MHHVIATYRSSSIYNLAVSFHTTVYAHPCLACRCLKFAFDTLEEIAVVAYLAVRSTNTLPDELRYKTTCRSDDILTYKNW